jgi:DMSO reductase iron-sulfur subunit
MYQRRENEPDYACLRGEAGKSHNQWGTPIETVPEGHSERGQSLRINADDAFVSDNPNRYKQHGFFFNADNCIACHACETACSEKNDNPAHQAFRSVGFIEGGTFPNVARLNISLACNHCDDPVCLKGCPTRAYTKHAEYGAVLQNPDICFGCGYCTWVCPYNAPQLDQVKGVVSKCNMCVDRLEVGLKPACVSACVGKALDFGVVESIPEGRSEAKVQIPGFPSPEITHPNTRFQQTRPLPPEMQRADSVPIKFHRKNKDGSYEPVLDPKHGTERLWSLKKLLGSHENSHIAFTLTAQLAAGAFALLTAGAILLEPLQGLQGSSAWLPSLLLTMALLVFGMFKLNMHLGRPHRFYRGFYNLQYSPVSREIAGVSVFTTGLGAFLALAVTERLLPGLIAQPLLGTLQQGSAAAAGLGILVGGYYMIKLYRIKARPFWNHGHTDASFVASALSLGALLPALVALPLGLASTELVQILAAVAAAGLALEGGALIAHARHLRGQKGEGAAAFYIQTTTYGRSYQLRNALLATALVTAGAAVAAPQAGFVLLPLLAVLAVAQSILGRALFFAAVMPTTMPGAFFWRNPGFVEHARKVGLADMPQVGVVREGHHPFRLGRLLATLRDTSLQDKLGQAKRVFTGA